MIENLRMAQKLQNDFAQTYQDGMTAGYDMKKLEEEVTNEMVLGIKSKMEVVK